MAKLVPPYGGKLVNLVLDADAAKEQFDRAQSLPSVQISERALCDLEMIAVGGMSPLRSFMGKEDYGRVLDDMRLADGTLWPIPITLAIDPPEGFALDKGLALRNSKNNLIAVLDVTEAFEADARKEALATLGTEDSAHPLAAEMQQWGKTRVAGDLKVISLPPKWNFVDYRLTPEATRERLAECAEPALDDDVRRVLAFQTRKPIYRVHEEMVKRAAEELDALLLLHPVVGLTRPGEVDLFTRCRIYRSLYHKYFDQGRTVLSFLPLAKRFAGPREALWHGIMRRNYGANHFVVDRNHASPGLNSAGKPFYEPHAAQDLFAQHAEEIGVKMVPEKMLVYLPGEDRYEEAGKTPPEVETHSISEREAFEHYLAQGRDMPEWFAHKETSEILRDANPPNRQKGFCVWFTGLSGSGKSTTAEILVDLLMEHGRNVTVLDGDVVRTHLSKGLGFSKQDRDTNILRIGYVASEIARHGGAVVCAAISPYRATRNQVRGMFADDAFVLSYVNTPVEVCEQRDVKGLYAKARRGEIKEFTGVSDPFEEPDNPEVTVDTVHQDPFTNAQGIASFLRERGFID